MTAPSPEMPASIVRRVVSAALLVFFGLFIAYDVWEGLGNLVGVVQRAGELDYPLKWWAWIVLIGQCVLPLAVLLVAYVLGRRRSLGAQTALYALAVCVSAALYLNVLALFSDAELIDITLF